MANLLKFKRKFPESYLLEEKVKFYSVGAKNIYLSLCHMISFSNALASPNLQSYLLVLCILLL